MFFRIRTVWSSFLVWRGKYDLPCSLLWSCCFFESTTLYHSMHSLAFYIQDSFAYVTVSKSFYVYKFFSTSSLASCATHLPKLTKSCFEINLYNSYSYSVIHNIEEGSEERGGWSRACLPMLFACDEVAVSESQNCALIFVAEYIAFKICNKIKCEGCITTKTTRPSDVQLGNTYEHSSGLWSNIQGLDGGGLTWPSELLLDIVVEALCCIPDSVMSHSQRVNSLS